MITDWCWIVEEELASETDSFVYPFRATPVSDDIYKLFEGMFEHRWQFIVKDDAMHTSKWYVVAAFDTDGTKDEEDLEIAVNLCNLKYPQRSTT